MKRLVWKLVAVAAAVIGVWYLCNQQRISSLGDAIRLAQSQVGLTFRTASAGVDTRQSIRVASFNLQAFGEAKIRDPQVAGYLARILCEFDVVAIQEVRGSDVSFLHEFVRLINSTGRNYDAIASEPVETSRFVERTAFVFNRDVVSLDGSHAYSVQDPDNILHRKPFVAWFRVAHPVPDRAFTFSLVNIHLDSRQPLQEMSVLGQVFRAIRADGRAEDDVVIAGDFNAAPDYLRSLEQNVGLRCLILGPATNVQLTQHCDNILIHPLATTEFMGRSGAYDFLKTFNLTMEQASAISDHLPVWAEFSIHEGYQRDLTAAASPPTTTK